jgi:hypothetical protein
MEQLICHLIGDYVLQSHWMAQNKTKSHGAALMHALCYSLPFSLLCDNGRQVFVIQFTHFLIDRYALARFVVYAKNYLLNPSWLRDEKDFPSWEECKATGFPPDVPTWLSVWLLIITDNTLHLTINYIALRWL